MKTQLVWLNSFSSVVSKSSRSNQNKQNAEQIYWRLKKAETIIQSDTYAVLYSLKVKLFYFCGVKFPSPAVLKAQMSVVYKRIVTEQAHKSFNLVNVYSSKSVQELLHPTNRRQIYLLH